MVVLCTVKDFESRTSASTKENKHAKRSRFISTATRTMVWRRAPRSFRAGVSLGPGGLKDEVHEHAHTNNPKDGEETIEEDEGHDECHILPWRWRRQARDMTASAYVMMRVSNTEAVLN